MLALVVQDLIGTAAPQIFLDEMCFDHMGNNNGYIIPIDGIPGVPKGLQVKL